MANISPWIEGNFCKRECIKFVPSSRDNARCCCGQLWQCHRDGSPATLRGGDEPHWSPSRHTHLLPTDAYGTIEFLGSSIPTKAQYVRLSHDTRPDLIIDLLTREWGQDLPKLLITVQGGKANFDLQPKLKKVIRKGLAKAAKTTGAWVFTAGTNTGVTRHVGEALLSESSVRVRGGGRVVSVGIAPWGIVERRHELIGRNREVPYHPINAPRSRFAALNSHHTYFLLVDNGTAGKYGAELLLRRRLENYVSKQRIHARGGLVTPVVCVVIEGGPNTIRQVLEYVTDSPPVPVIVCDGTGRAADILAFVYKCVADGRMATPNTGVYDSVRGVVVASLQREFDLTEAQADLLFEEVLQCARMQELLTVFRLTEGAELDQAILSALLHSHALSDPERLSLALTWNRVDIARTHVFNEDVEWSQNALELAMMDALVHDRIEFVELLLEQGVTMTKFLTVARLEDLYNAKQGPPNTLRYIIRDVKKNIPRDYRYTLPDIGLVINKLMGGAFRSTYTRRKFRNFYHALKSTRTGSTYRPTAHPQQPAYKPMAPAVDLSSPFSSPQHGNSHLLGASLNRSLSPKASAVSSPTDRELLGTGEKAGGSLSSPIHFDYPFSELMVWAVLTKRQGLALLTWQHGEEALAKSLVAAKLYKALALEAADDDLETEVHEELCSYAKEFETLAVELLTHCYQQDDDRAHELLTYELRNWSKQTCLSLAAMVNHRSFIALPCCQLLLADLWLGGLRTRKNTNFKVLLGLLFPPIVTCLGFRSREELRTMPQTREERWEVGGEHGGSGGPHCRDSDTGSDSEGEGGDAPSSKTRPSDGGETEQRGGGGVHTTIIKVPLLTTHKMDSNEAPKNQPQQQGKPPNATVGRPVPVGGALPNPPPYVFPFIPPNSSPNSVFGHPQPAEENGHPPRSSMGRAPAGGASAEDRHVGVRRRSTLPQLRREGTLPLPPPDGGADQRAKELSARIKFYEFYNAPITKFWAHSVAYIVFLCFYTYVVLVRLPPTPHWTEAYVIVYILTLLCEKLRQVLAKEPHELKQKLEVWAENRWNVWDTACGGMFVVGLVLRLQSHALHAGRVIYCTNIIYWYLKILEILSSDKYLGPLVMMMGKMIQQMAYFVILLLVVLMAFGVCRQSILNPDEPPHWRLARHIFFQPYFMLYGEVFAGDIDPDCGGEGQIPCHPGRWITPTAMSIYLLVANILMINLLIAVFNNIFTALNAMSQQVWKFQRFQVVMEFEERPVFPPPLILLSHIHRTVKYLKRRWLGKPPLHDNGLKLFLDAESLERVHDFEEECVYSYRREKEHKEQMSTEERVRQTAERSEVISQRLEDFNTKLLSAMNALNTAEFRIKRLEEELGYAKDSYSVIHRFMVTYMDQRRSRSSSPRSDFGSRDESPGTQTSPLESGGYSSRSALRSMLEETGTNMFKKRYSSVSEEDESIVGSSDDEKFDRKLSRRKSGHKLDSGKKEDVKSDELGTDLGKVSNVEGVPKRRSFKRPPRRRSESGSLAKAARERKISHSHSKPRRKSNRDSSKEKDLDKNCGSSRVSFKVLEDSYSQEDSGTGHESQDQVCVSDRRSVQRSMSSPADHTQGPREQKDRERSHSSSSSRPRIKVIPPSSPPPPVIKINAEYTSLADELENVVMARLSPPSTPGVWFGRVRHHSEGMGMSLRSFQHPLRDAEEADFLIMEGVIQRRLHRDSENLAISLEELCSIHTEITDRELNPGVQFSGESNVGVVDRSGIVEEYSVVQEVASKSFADPEVGLGPNSNSANGTNRVRRLGNLGELKKRHSIGVGDSSKLGVDPTSEAAVSPPPQSVEAHSEFPESSGPAPTASPEPSHVNSPHSPGRVRAFIPRQLSLSTAGSSLLPPSRSITSPIHPLLMVNPSVALPSVSYAPSASLVPPVRQVSSPVFPDLFTSHVERHLHRSQSSSSVSERSPVSPMDLRPSHTADSTAGVPASAGIPDHPSVSAKSTTSIPAEFPPVFQIKTVSRSVSSVCPLSSAPPASPTLARSVCALSVAVSAGFPASRRSASPSSQGPHTQGPPLNRDPPLNQSSDSTQGHPATECLPSSQGPPSTDGLPSTQGRPSSRGAHPSLGLSTQGPSTDSPPRSRGRPSSHSSQDPDSISQHSTHSSEELRRSLGSRQSSGRDSRLDSCGREHR